MAAVQSEMEKVNTEILAAVSIQALRQSPSSQPVYDNQASGKKRKVNAFEGERVNVIDWTATQQRQPDRHNHGGEYDASGLPNNNNQQ